MTAAWNVPPHEPIEELAENLWCVEASVPGIPLTRRMTLARLRDATVVIHNPVVVGPESLERIEAWGRPAYIVVPGGYHRLDCGKFKQRYPEAKVVCPAGSRKRIEQVVAVDLTYAEARLDDRVELEHADGVANKEGVMKVRSADGTTLVFNDLLFNMRHQPGASGFGLRLIGSTGGPRVTFLFRLLAVEDKRALRAYLERQADAGVVRLVPGHGDLVKDDAAGVLRLVASRL